MLLIVFYRRTKSFTLSPPACAARCPFSEGPSVHEFGHVPFQNNRTHSAASETAIRTARTAHSFIRGVCLYTYFVVAVARFDWASYKSLKHAKGCANCCAHVKCVKQSSQTEILVYLGSCCECVRLLVYVYAWTEDIVLTPWQHELHRRLVDKQSSGTE
eukprot:5542798-Pleurochrysis_carterae.AAC.1